MATFFLLIAGGLVTSNDAGLAVPDWPLSFGKVMPDMVGGVFYEHGHRMIAASVGFLTILLALWLSRSEKRSWVRGFGWLSLAAVIIQGGLGGLTVLLMLPPAVSVLHASLAQTFFCLVVTIAFVTSKRWMVPEQWGKTTTWNREAATAAVMLGVIYIQLILGATVRHSGMVGGSKGAELVMPALLIHILGALVVTAAVLHGVFSITKKIRAGMVAGISYWLFGLLLVQITLGIGAYMVRLSVPTRIQPLPMHVGVTTAHLAVGALMLASSIVLMLRLTRTDPGGMAEIISGDPAEEHS
jgi:cytochrome c oxidase assembly protein subunit 15